MTLIVRLVCPQVLVLASLVAVALSAPQGITFGPSATYSYRFEGPEQTKEESRDALGNIKGSYSITYPNGGGTLTYNYAHPVTLPVFRTTDDGPLGPAGTVIAIQRVSSTVQYWKHFSKIFPASNLP